MNDREESVGGLLAHYKRVSKWVAVALIPALATCIVSIAHGIYAIGLFSRSVADGLATPEDLLYGIKYLCFAQMVLGASVAFCAWLWWLTVRGIIKRLSRLAD